MIAKAFNRICAIMFILGWLNFMVFCCIGQHIGGEALHGKVEDGHYYLATGYISHGFQSPDAPHHYIEVSSDIFHYSKVHAYSVLVTFPLGLLACSLAVLFAKKQKREITEAG